MQPVNVDGLAQYLGPGTGGLFMGEQQRNAMQESEINQQKGLEDILNQRQTRDIQKQKLPFELQQAEQNVLKAKGEVAKQATDAEDRLEKLDKQRVSDFMGDILQYQGVDNPLDNAFQLQALAQKHKLDGNDPRIRSIMMNSMDKAGIKKMQQALIESDPKWQADRKKAEEELAKAREEIAGRERVAAGNNAATLGAARINADARTAAAAAKQQATDIFQAAMTGKVPPERAAVALKMMASKEQDPDTRNYLNGLAAQMEQMALQLGNARNQSGGMSIQNGQITERPPQQPTPAAPVAPAVAGPAASPNQVPPVQAPPQPAGPPPDMAPAFQKAGWQYEPQKYDYRVGPDGKLQRKPKGQ